MPATFLPDGYTRETLLGASDRHPAVRIAWRPMLAAERRRLNLQTVRLNTCGNAGQEAAAQLVAAAIAARLVEWDLADAAGRLVEIGPAAVAALEPHLFETICSTVTAFEDEEESARNLIDGVLLLSDAPHVALRDCGHCQTYVYNEKTGLPWESPPHSGRLILRPAGTLPPCRISGIGCPRGTPENPRGLSVANHAAWCFDRECRAIGSFPDDALVRRNAWLIRHVEEDLEHRDWDKFRRAVLAGLGRSRP